MNKIIRDLLDEVDFQKHHRYSQINDVSIKEHIEGYLSDIIDENSESDYYDNRETYFSIAALALIAIEELDKENYIDDDN